MANYTYANSLTDLNILLGDSSDTTFTPEEKQRAMSRAWNDSFVTRRVWNTSLTYSQGTYQYALPSGVTTISDIYLATTSSLPMPDPIEASLWEVIGANLQFHSAADRLIPTGYTLYLRGRYKLTTSDTIDDVSEVALKEYVLALAGFNTLNLLGHKKANLFLKNDMTMAELIGFRRELQADVREARARLQRQYQSG